MNLGEALLRQLYKEPVTLERDGYFIDNSNTIHYAVEWFIQDGEMFYLLRSLDDGAERMYFPDGECCECNDTSRDIVCGIDASEIDVYLSE